MGASWVDMVERIRACNRVSAPSSHAVHGPLRWLAGALLAALAAVLALGAGRLEFGIGWTALVPAAALLVPAAALLQRRRLTISGGRIEVHSGWLMRRCWSLPLDRAELELVPTAGLCAVVLHAGGRETALATWIGAGRAGRLCAWLDAHHPAGAFPRRACPPPPGDR
jgi:hypothetical protein